MEGVSGRERSEGSAKEAELPPPSAPLAAGLLLSQATPGD